MIAGPYNFTGTQSIVQGKTLRRRFTFTDAAGDPLPVGAYEWRAAFKASYDGENILFLSSNGSLPGITAESQIILEPDDGDGPLEGTIELVVSDETMETILHTAWTERQFTGAPSKYQGVWELEAEDQLTPGDTLPMLAGKVNFIREVVR